MSARPPSQRMKWWGWGLEEKRLTVPDHALSVLRERLGEAEPAQRVDLEHLDLPEIVRLPARVVQAAGGEAAVWTDHETRVRHGAGRSYPDLVGLRSGHLESAPDAIVAPAETAAVGELIVACSAEGVAVVPFGGGTSVVGGVDALRGNHEAVLSLDLSRLCRVRVDRVSHTAELGAGLRGPQAESALKAHGFTIGHFPQSFEYATIGGFAATRSAGQASSGYGRFDELVTALRMLTPIGELRTLETPHSAAGPALRELALGSEGTLGVIADVTVRVQPAPAVSRYEAWVASGFAAGREIVRELAQADLMPDVLRLSDEEETAISLALSGAGARGRLLDAYLGLRRLSDACIMICGWEGDRVSVETQRAQSLKVLRRAGAVPLGSRAGESWRRGRFEGPYLRDELMDLGYLVDTLETSQSWSRLDSLYEVVRTALRQALEAGGTPPIVFCHVSHAYPDGASLYFTFIARRRPGSEVEQWQTAKDAAGRAIVTAGGTITHHHAVGRMHAPYMRDEVGEVGLEALRALKAQLDPTGIMNPGKLIPG